MRKKSLWQKIKDTLDYSLTAILVWLVYPKVVAEAERIDRQEKERIKRMIARLRWRFS
jgi:hypothetical protein